MDFGTQQYWPDGTNIDGQTGNSDRNCIRDLSLGSANYVSVQSIVNICELFI